MTCAFDRELISLYANDDLNPAGRRAIAEHLHTCADCRAVLAQYEAGAAALAEAVAATPVPALQPRRPARRYALPATAAAAALALLMTAFAPQVEAVVSKVFTLVPDMFRVEEYTPDELEQVVNHLPEGATPITPVEFGSLAEAEQVLGYRVASLPSLPSGFALTSVQVTVPDQPHESRISQVYTSADGLVNLHLDQVHDGKATVRTAEGTTREVLVGSGSAALVEFSKPTPDGERTTRSLFFTWENQAMHLGSDGPADRVLSEQELIALAQSLQ